MNYIREVKAHFTNNLLLISVHVVLVMILLVIAYTTVEFSIPSDIYRDNHFNRIFESNDMYSITNALYGEEYSAFTRDPRSIKRISLFYDEINNNQNFTFLSSDKQPVIVFDFRGDESFGDGYQYGDSELDIWSDETGNQTGLTVKAFQMNEALFDFNSLLIQSGGDVISWSNIDYSTRQIPVLLGNSYIGIYEIGDILSVLHFFLEFQFEIVGFTEENSHVFHENAEGSLLNLDEYILIPYPHTLAEFFESDVSMEDGIRFILAFSMTRGNIVVDREEQFSAQNLIDIFAGIAKRTGFEHYLFLGVSLIHSERASMTNLFYLNRVLITCMFILSIVLTASVLVGVSSIYFDRRRNTYQAYLSCGLPSRFLLRLAAMDVGLPLLLASIFAWPIIDSIFRVYWVPKIYFFLAGFFHLHHFVITGILLFLFITSYYYIYRKVVRL